MLKKTLKFLSDAWGFLGLFFFFYLHLFIYKNLIEISVGNRTQLFLELCSLILSCPLKEWLSIK